MENVQIYRKSPEKDHHYGTWDLPKTERGSYVFLVDCSESMFKSEPSGLRQSLEVCKEAMRNICRKQGRDLVAVVLFNTKETKGPHAPSNVVLLEELAVPKVKTIVGINEIIKDDCKELKATYGHSTKVSLHEVLRYAQLLILKSKIKTYVKYIVLFTCTDNPYLNDSSMEMKARKQVQEFLKLCIDFDVVGLGDSFDSSKFYKELVLTAQGELLKDWASEDPILEIDRVAAHLSSFSDRYNRRFTTINLSKDYKVYVALHKLYSAPHPFRLKPKNIPPDDEFSVAEPMEGDDDDRRSPGAPTTTSTRSDPVESHPQKAKWWMSRKDLVPYMGHRQIRITKDELKQKMIYKSKGFEFIGFVKSSNVPFYYAHGEPHVVIPSLNKKNNLLVFSHLLNKCLAEDLSILSWFSLNDVTSPVLCALHPTKQSEYAPGRVHPPCFLSSKLWFSDMIYEPDFEPETILAEPSENQLNAMKDIIRNTSLAYSVDKFCDVSNEYRTNMIEALAFGEDDVKQTEDCTLVNFEQLISDELARMAMDCSHLGGPMFSQPAKRRGAGSEGASRSKVARSENEALQLVERGLADKLTVAELKNLLARAGVKNLSGMTKSRLIDAAYQHVKINK